MERILGISSLLIGDLKKWCSSKEDNLNKQTLCSHDTVFYFVYMRRTLPLFKRQTLFWDLIFHLRAACLFTYVKNEICLSLCFYLIHILTLKYRVWIVYPKTTHCPFKQSESSLVDYSTNCLYIVTCFIIVTSLYCFLKRKETIRLITSTNEHNVSVVVHQALCHHASIYI